MGQSAPGGTRDVEGPEGASSSSREGAGGPSAPGAVGIPPPKGYLVAGRGIPPAPGTARGGRAGDGPGGVSGAPRVPGGSSGGVGVPFPPPRREKGRAQGGGVPARHGGGKPGSPVHWAWTRWSAGGRLVQAYGASQLLVRGEALEGRDGVSVRDALAILAEVGGRFPARGGPELVGRVFQALGCCLGASSGLWLDFLPGKRIRVRSHWGNFSLLPEEGLLFVSPHVPWLRSLRRGEPVILDSFGGPRPSSSLGRRFTGDGNRASLALPIPSSAKAVRGFFLLAWEGGERIWDENERAVLRLLAGWAGRMGSLSPRRPRPESIHPETSWGLPSEPPGRSSSDPSPLPPRGAGGKALRSQGT